MYYAQYEQYEQYVPYNHYNQYEFFISNCSTGRLFVFTFETATQWFVGGPMGIPFGTAEQCNKRCYGTYGETQQQQWWE